MLSPYLMNWWDVCRIYLLLCFLVRLPFVVQYLSDRDETFHRWRAARNEGKFQLYVCLAIATISFVVLAESNALAWAQYCPFNETAAWFGVALGALSLLSFVVIHIKLFKECNQMKSVEQKEELSGAGPFTVTRYPFCSNFAVLPLCVLLMTHNWFYALLWAVWILNAVLNVDEEEVLGEVLVRDLFEEIAADTVEGAEEVSPTSLLLDEVEEEIEEEGDLLPLDEPDGDGDGVSDTGERGRRNFFVEDSLVREESDAPKPLQ
jgi:protein-S-isoprenylcysteine O-methyltransferase Ste14